MPSLISAVQLPTASGTRLTLDSFEKLDKSEVSEHKLGSQ